MRELEARLFSCSRLLRKAYGYLNPVGITSIFRDNRCPMELSDFANNIQAQPEM